MKPPKKKLSPEEREKQALRSLRERFDGELERFLDTGMGELDIIHRMGKVCRDR